MRKKLKQHLALFLSLAMAVSLNTGVAGAVSVNKTDARTNGKTAEATVTETTNLTDEHLSANGITTKDNGLMRTDLSSKDMILLMGQGWNYGNSLEAKSTIKLDSAEDYEKAWGATPLTQKAVDGLKRYGINTVRVPVAWSNMISDDGKYTIDESYFNRVEEVINYCLNDEMYVIINIHWDGGWWGQFGSKDEAVQAKAWARFESFWTQISERYKEYSDRLIFESANEELGDRLNDELDADGNPYENGKSEGDPIKGGLSKDECYEMTTQINQKFVDIVRQSGGNNTYRHLLIAGYNTDFENTCSPKYVMPTDIEENGISKLSVSVHYYTPSYYCISESSTVSWGYSDKWGTESEIKQMEDLFTKMSQFTEAGYGVMIGEYGVCNSSKNGIPLFIQKVMEYSKQFNFLPVIWDTGIWYDRIKNDFCFKDVAEVFINATGVDITPPKDGATTGVPEMPIIEDVDSMRLVGTWTGKWTRTDGSAAIGGYEQTSCDPTLTVTSNAYFWQVFFTADWASMTRPAIRVTPADDSTSQKCDLQMAYTNKVDGAWKNSSDYQDRWVGSILELDKEWLTEYPYIMLSSNAVGASFVKIEIFDAIKTETPPPTVTQQPSVTSTATPPAVAATAEASKTVTKSGLKYSVKVNGTAVVKAPVKKTNKKVTIPATIKADGKTYKVTEIAKNAFKNNKKLTQVTIGTNVKKIGASAFEGCKKLKTINVKSKKLNSVGKNAIKGIQKKAAIKAPKAKVKAYKKLFNSKTGYKKTMKVKKA